MSNSSLLSLTSGNLFSILGRLVHYSPWLICTWLLIKRYRELSLNQHTFISSGKFKTRKDRTKELIDDVVSTIASNMQGNNSGSSSDSSLLYKVKELRLPLSPSFNEFFVNKDDLLIHVKRWPRPAKPKAIVIICHGLGEYATRHDHLAREFVDNDVVVYGIDQQGHGRSEGDRMFVNKFEDFVDDMIHLTKIAIYENPELEHNVFLLGFSMGGAIVTRTVIKAQKLYKGAILCAPALVLDEELTPQWKRNIAKTFSRFIPRFMFNSVPPLLLSNEEAVVSWFINDPSVVQAPTNARIGAELLGAAEFIAEHSHKITIPILILHGDEDKLCLLKGSEEFMKMIKSKSKQLVALKGIRHDIFHDNFDATVKSVAAQWLVQTNKE